jgi:alkylated DNA repair protein alkB family protein 6
VVPRPLYDKPHEDGPAYHPAVATISLGAPQCVDIYQYLSTTNPSPPLVATPATDTSATSQTSETQEQGGRTIAHVPLARIYLAPRSLLVMASALYTTHLHGISETTEDVITAADAPGPDRTTAAAQPGAGVLVPVANLSLLSEAIRQTVREKGGKLFGKR